MPAARDAHLEPPSLRAALTPRVLRLSLVGALGYLAISGMSFVVALLAADELGAGPTLTGVIVAGFGVAGVVAGRLAGRLADRRGPATASAAGALVCAVALPLTGIADSALGVSAAWTLAGVGSALVWSGPRQPGRRGRPRQPRGRDVGVLGVPVRRARAGAGACGCPCSTRTRGCRSSWRAH